MVTAPKCKVCGVAHFGSAHVWPKVKDVTTSATPEEKAWAEAAHKLEPQEVYAAGRTIAKFDAEPTGPKRDRAAYMREYRARQKGKE
jgi:hypothetical protein